MSIALNLIKKIEAVTYSLSPTRIGTLLKVHFFLEGQEVCGYGDCHPWIEFGDQPLSLQLENLKQKKLSSLLERSLYFAYEDAKLRLSNRWAFEGLKEWIPKTDLLISFDELANLDDFSFLEQMKTCSNINTLKLKAFRDPEKELELLKRYKSKLRNKRLRLDMNEKASRLGAEAYLQALKRLRLTIDFVEDPCPPPWDGLQKSIQIPLAADFVPVENLEKSHFSVQIFKPARHKKPMCDEDHRIVFTNSLDHPLGQVQALWEAATFYKQSLVKQEVCGFVGRILYPGNAYSNFLCIKEERVYTLPACGFGFDSLLNQEPWERIC